jgi:hypothetical protein
LNVSLRRRESKLGRFFSFQQNITSPDAGGRSVAGPVTGTVFLLLQVLIQYLMGRWRIQHCILQHMEIQLQQGLSLTDICKKLHIAVKINMVLRIRLQMLL